MSTPHQRSNPRCSEPGHRALVAIHASRGPVAELGSLASSHAMNAEERDKQRRKALVVGGTEHSTL